MSKRNAEDEPQSEAKRLREIISVLESDAADCNVEAAAEELMKRLEAEISGSASGEGLEVPEASAENACTDGEADQMSYLRHASDDELGLPPSPPASASAAYDYEDVFKPSEHQNGGLCNDYGLLEYATLYNDYGYGYGYDYDYFVSGLLGDFDSSNDAMSQSLHQTSRSAANVM